MEAKELRIGNWVFDKLYSKSPVQVFYLTEYYTNRLTPITNTMRYE